MRGDEGKMYWRKKLERMERTDRWTDRVRQTERGRKEGKKEGTRVDYSSKLKL